MNYTHDPNQVVFLKDTDIVKDTTGKNEAGNLVEENGIASYTLVSGMNEQLTALKDKFDEEQSFNLSAVRYLGEVTLRNDFVYQNVTINPDKKLYGLLFGSDKVEAPSSYLCAGFLFKAVADDPARTSYDYTHENDQDSTVLHPNDYIFLKHDVAAVSDITFADVNIIRDYDLSIANLQRDVNALTTTVDAEGTGLVARVNSISADVITDSSSLSNKFSAFKTGINGKVDGLSTKLLDETTGFIPNLCATVTSTISDAITGISNTISAENVGLSAQVTSISSSVITAENSLSNKVNDLSVKLLNEDPGTEEDPKTIGLIPDLRSDVELSAKDLSDAITAIRSDVKGGVNYKGHLKLNMFNEPYDLSTYVALLHGGSYAGEDITITDEVKNKELNNGWMYYISLTGNEVNPPPSSYTTHDKITFVPGNYIIVHAHNTSGDADTSLSSVKVCDIKRENIDIIQVTDSDLVRFQNLNDVSDALCTSTTALVSSISNTLSDALTTHIGDYNQLCTTLSTSISTLSTDVHTTVSNAIDNKVQLSVAPENGVGNPTTTNIDTLVINRMSIQQYESLVEAGQTHDDQIYVINDDNQSLFGHDISNINDVQAASGHIDTLSVGSLTAAGSIQAAELNIEGAGNVNVAKVNATEQISVAGDAFVANSNGNVVADKLSAVELSTPALSASSITAVVADFTTVNSSTVKSTNVSATQANADSLAVKNTCVVADKLTADNNGLSIDGNLSVNADVRAGNISAATISATDQIIVDGKLTATNGGLTANGKLSTNNDLDVAGNLSVGNTSLSAKGLSADNSGINTPNLTATTISTQTLTVANSIQLFNDQYGINKDATDNALNIKTPGAQNPQLKINGKYLTSYYAEYLSAEYLSDGYIESIETSMSNDISGIKITWNDQIKEGSSAKVHFIPLSSLGGIYDEAGTIIRVNKTQANSFKISADPAAISDAIDEALYDDFGIQSIKDELSNKILLQNGTAPAQKVDSMTIHKMTLTQYKGMSPDQRVSSDIYVIEDDNIDAFDGKIINLADPDDPTDAANKKYVDNKISTLNAAAETSASNALTSAKNYTDQVSNSLNTTLTAAIETAKSNAIDAAKDYTDQANGVLNTSIEEKIQYKADPTSQPENISNLTIQKITAASYSALTDAEKNRKDVIYSITGTDYNMFGNKIVALAGPENPTDAANKAYVDTSVDAAKVALSGNLSFADDSDNSKMLLKLGEQQIAYFDYGPFIKDGMLENVEVSANSSNVSVLVFTFNADNQTRIITVPLTSLAEVYSPGTYTIITKQGETSHNTSIIDVNIAAVQNAIDNSIRSNIVEDNLTVLNKHNSTIGTWNAPAAGSPLAQLSGAISSAIKTDMTSADNRISNALSNAVSSNYVFASEFAGLTSNANTGTGVFGRYALANECVSKSALSSGNDSYISTLMNDYYAKSKADITFAPIGISSTISSTYVSAVALAQDAKDGDGVFIEYAKKVWLTGDGGSNQGILADYATTANYVSNNALSDPTNGILRNYYTKDELEGNGGNSPALRGTYQLLSNMTNYETTTNVNQLITNMRAGVNSITAITKISEDTSFNGDGGGDIDILRAKVDELVNGMNTIVKMLSAISKEPPTP